MHNTIFGTDGIRCAMNSSYLTEENLSRLGRAIALWAPQQSHFVFGSDTRASCEKIKAILSRELFLHGHHISDAEIVPTPMLCMMVEQNPEYNFGIMITASHNPAHDNGIKLITPTKKLSVADELHISHLFHAAPANTTLSAEGEKYPLIDFLSVLHSYSSKIKKQLVHRKFNMFKVVLDCAHGATSLFAREIFKEFGFEVITINNQPNGSNINQDSGALHPEQLIERVFLEQADFGCAFDGDGDRLVIVTGSGTILDGDQLLAIFAQHPHYQQETVYAGTIMSNQAVESYFISRGKKFTRTDVGDKNIVAELAAQNALLGTEPSGHIILRDHSFCSDGIYAALLFFDTLLCDQNLKLPLFKSYPNIQKNIVVQEKKDLSAQNIQKIIKLYEKALVPGRLIIRYSGTEPVLRFAIEHENQEFAQTNMNNLVNELLSYL